MIHHPAAAINGRNWKATRRNLNKILAWISRYEELYEELKLWLKETRPISNLKLAMWKLKIKEMDAATVEGLSACRGEVGPAKDAILQYLQGDIGEDGGVKVMTPSVAQITILKVKTVVMMGQMAAVKMKATK